jgi:hypothetical protein
MVGVSLPWPEDGDRSSFRNVVFSSYLEFWTIDKAHKSGDSECYTSSSEHFRFRWHMFKHKVHRSNFPNRTKECFLPSDVRSASTK